MIEEKEDALLAVKEVTKLETADKRDILMVEEIKDPDLEADLDQDHQVMIDIVDEEETEVEIEAMMIQEVEEEIEVVEMITEETLLTVKVIAMIVEEIEKFIQEIEKIETIAEEGIQDQIQDIVNKKEDQEIINIAVKKVRAHKNLKAKTKRLKKVIMPIELKEVHEEVSQTINNLEVESRVNHQKILGITNKNLLKVKISK